MTDLYEAIVEGAVERVRPKLMTVTAIMAGLLPSLWGCGTYSLCVLGGLLFPDLTTRHQSLERFLPGFILALARVTIYNFVARREARTRGLRLSRRSAPTGRAYQSVVRVT